MSMMSIFKAKVESTAIAPLDQLEAVLLDMERYGSPRLYRLGRGWHCNVEANVSQLGARFEIASEFTHSTPLDAALTCRNRLVSAIKTIGGVA